MLVIALVSWIDCFVSFCSLGTDFRWWCLYPNPPVTLEPIPTKCETQMLHIMLPIYFFLVLQIFPPFHTLLQSFWIPFFLHLWLAILNQIQGNKRRRASFITPTTIYMQIISSWEGKISPPLASSDQPKNVRGSNDRYASGKPCSHSGIHCNLKVLSSPYSNSLLNMWLWLFLNFQINFCSLANITIQVLSLLRRGTQGVTCLVWLLKLLICLIAVSFPHRS